MDALLDAVLAVSAGLDLDQTLQQIVHAAMELVDARYGALGVLGTGAKRHHRRRRHHRPVYPISPLMGVIGRRMQPPAAAQPRGRRPPVEASPTTRSCVPSIRARARALGHDPVRAGFRGGWQPVRRFARSREACRAGNRGGAAAGRPSDSCA